MNDILYFQLDERVVYAKVVGIKFERDVTYFEKVLDINDEEISSKYLPRHVEIDVLSFNQYAGYLLDGTFLQSVKLAETPLRQLTPLPSYSLQFRGLFESFLEPKIFSDTFEKLSYLVTQK